MYYDENVSEFINTFMKDVIRYRRRRPACSSSSIRYFINILNNFRVFIFIVIFVYLSAIYNKFYISRKNIYNEIRSSIKVVVYSEIVRPTANYHLQISNIGYTRIRLETVEVLRQLHTYAMQI